MECLLVVGSLRTYVPIVAGLRIFGHLNRATRMTHPHRAQDWYTTASADKLGAAPT